MIPSTTPTTATAEPPALPQAEAITVVAVTSEPVTTADAARPAAETPGKTTAAGKDKADKQKFTFRWWLRKFALHTTVFWVVYTLSIGPMFWFWFEAVYAGGPRWISRLYVPLVLACYYVPWFGDLVNWYINWWIL